MVGLCLVESRSVFVVVFVFVFVFVVFVFVFVSVSVFVVFVFVFVMFVFAWMKVGRWWWAQLLKVAAISHPDTGSYPRKIQNNIKLALKSCLSFTNTYMKLINKLNIFD